MNDAELSHIVYISNAEHPLTEAEIEDIVTTARFHNQHNNVTGVLLFNAGTFIQCIEGPKKEIDETYERIVADPRHKNLIKLVDEPIEQRSFEGWQMGSTKLSESDYLKLSTSDWTRTIAGQTATGHHSDGFKLLLGFWNLCTTSGSADKPAAQSPA